MAGNDWETTIVLFNPGSAAVTFRAFFLAPDGKTVSFSIHNLAGGEDLTTSAVEGVLAPSSTLSFCLLAPRGESREGWSLLSFTGTDGVLDGYAKLRHRSSMGAISFEVTMRLSELQDVAQYMPFDNTEGFRSHLTLVNPSNISTRVRLTYFNPHGAVILIDSITLRPAQQITVSLPDTYPDLANQTGAVFIQADTDRLSVAGLRYNDAYGAIAPLPTITGGPLPGSPQ